MTIAVSTQLYGGAKLDQLWPLLEQAADPQLGVEIFPEPHLKRYAPLLQCAIPRLCGRSMTFHGPYWGIDPCFVPQSPEAAVYERYWRETLADAKALGAKYVVYHLYNHHFTAWEQLAKRAAAMQTLGLTCRWAAEYGVQLAIENTETSRHAGENLLTQQEYMDLVRARSDCGALIDIGHASCAGWDLHELMAELKDRILGCHLHNNDGVSDSHRTILDGVIDMERFAADVRRYTPDAILTLEYVPEFAADIDRICEDIRWLKSRGLG